MKSFNSDDLLYNNTHNSHNTLSKQHNCSTKRPCYRKANCQFCWNRYRKYILNQVNLGFLKYDFSQHVTISFDSVNDPFEAFLLLSKIRSDFARKMGRFTKYIMSISLGLNEDNACLEYCHIKITPHFHIITSKDFNRILIKQILDTNFSNLRTRIFTQEIPSSTDCKNVLGYMLDQNIKKALPLAPKNFRLLTASKGISTGRPKKINKADLSWVQI